MQVNNRDSSPPNVERTPKSELQGTSEEFLLMFIAQLQNQDPTDPMESTDMVKNIAQLNQISYLEDIKNSLDKLAGKEDSLSFGDIGSLIDKSVTYSAVRAPVGEHTGEVSGFEPGMKLTLVTANGSKIRDIALDKNGKFSEAISDSDGQAYFQVSDGEEVLNKEVLLEGKIKGVDVVSGEVILDNDHAILYDNIKKIISESYE